MKKRILALLFAGIFLLALAGCRKKADPPPPEKETAPPPERLDIAFAGWNEVSFDEALWTDLQLSQSATFYLPIMRFDSAEALAAFRQKYEEKLCFDHSYNETRTFDDVVKGYPADFFERYTLFIAYVESSSGSFRFAVDHVENDSSTFRMVVKYANHPEVYTDDMSGWWAFAAVGKETVASCTTFAAVLQDPYVPYADGILEQLPGMIMSEVHLSEWGGDLGYGLTASDILLLEQILTEVEWGPSYEDLPNYFFTFLDERKYSYNSENGLLTEAKTDRAAWLSDAQRQIMEKIICSYLPEG